MPALINWWTMDVRRLAARAPDRDVLNRLGTDLLRRWTEPGRRYHTTTHLVEMFGALEEIEDAHEIDDRQSCLARVAAWFHDAVYDPAARPGSNEADSALLARSSLGELDFADPDITSIEQLIRLTARHNADAAQPLDAAFHDADLWILSAPQARFDRYCDQVRMEFDHVPDDDYRKARAAILRPLLHRDRIYRTSHALHTWETPAQINLGRELSRLKVNA
jgi:predicted metal-dependent HD superfamily phosphohydrolase